MLQRKMTRLVGLDGAIKIGKPTDEHEDEVKMSNGWIGGEIQGKIEVGTDGIEGEKDDHTEMANIGDFVVELVSGVKGETEGFLLKTKLDDLTTNNPDMIRYESC